MVQQRVEAMLRPKALLHTTQRKGKEERIWISAGHINQPKWQAQAKPDQAEQSRAKQNANEEKGKGIKGKGRRDKIKVK